MVDGETGVVFRAGSTANLTSAIRRLASDPQLMTDMGRNARRFTLDNAPDSNDTYSTILQFNRPRTSDDEVPRFAEAA
jgi:hypothetical protein